MIRKDPLIFIEHIFESIRRVENFIADISEKSFKGNEEKQSAIIRQIEIIGEAAKNVPESFRKKYYGIPWSDVARTRDKLIHHYFGVNLDVIWDIVKKDLPELKKDIKDILDKERFGDSEI